MAAPAIFAPLGSVTRPSIRPPAAWTTFSDKVNTAKHTKTTVIRRSKYFFINPLILKKQDTRGPKSVSILPGHYQFINYASQALSTTLPSWHSEALER